MGYDNKGNLCTRCTNRSRRYWTEERVIEAILLFAERNGRRPGAKDFNDAASRALGYPGLNSVYGKNCPFASWSDAIAAAGFERPRDGHYINESKRSEILRKVRTG